MFESMSFSVKWLKIQYKKCLEKLSVHLLNQKRKVNGIKW